MSYRPSKSKRAEYARKLNEIEEYCNMNNITHSRDYSSYYFRINGQPYRVSNHSVEASNDGAYSWTGEQVRELYHPEGRQDNVVYIHAGKTRIMDIHRDLVEGYRLDGRGNRKYQVI